MVLVCVYGTVRVLFRLTKVEYETGQVVVVTQIVAWVGPPDGPGAVLLSG